MTRPVKIGVGMRDKRARILRSLATKIRYLEMCERLQPWTPLPHVERPPRPPDPYPYRADMRGRKWTPRERPELARRCPGPEALSEEQVAPYRQAGAPEGAARAFCYLDTCRRAGTPPRALLALQEAR